MSTPPFFVGIDVGGQSIKGGVVDDRGQRLTPRPAVEPTESDKGQQHGLGQMAKVVRDALDEAGLTLSDIAAIGVATPGTMDIPGGVMLEPVNFPGWLNVPVRQYIADEFKKPTAFQNDANAAAYGEFWSGCGRDAKSLVLFTLGTGIGCGIIVNDFIIEGEHSHGAECGHIVIEMTNGRMCNCGQRGHLEAYASAIAIAKRANEALAADSGQSTLRAHLQQKQEFEERDCGLIFEAAVAGDPLAKKLIEDTAYYLGVGAVNLMHTINPEMVVFGGGMIATGEWFLERIRYHAKRLAFKVPAAKTTICYAQLGSDAGFIGAAGCARQLWMRKPASVAAGH
jgi:glucokinase